MHIAHVDESHKLLTLVEEITVGTDDGGVVIVEHEIPVNLQDLERWANALGFRLEGRP